MDDIKAVVGAVLGAAMTALGFILGLDRHIDGKLERKMEPIRDAVKRSDVRDEKFEKWMISLDKHVSELQGDKKGLDVELRGIHAALNEMKGTLQKVLERQA